MSICWRLTSMKPASERSSGVMRPSSQGTRHKPQQAGQTLKAFKARTKAAKIQAKRGKPGRPRRKGAVREPNGRISRSGIRHEPADKTAIEARMRHMGLSRDQAQDQKAATYIGYLNLVGREDGLSDSQYEAATNYLSLRD